MPTVLVVDDAAVDRKIVGGLLGKLADVEVQYAADGAQALRMMSDSPPNLVITDLLMPEINGLELVNKIRMQHPKVPVILMTARGSETLAIQALRQGASSYVPKSQLSRRLRSTVEEVLARAHIDRTYARLLSCQRRIDFAYELENDVELINALAELVKQTVAGMGLCDHAGRFRISSALREAMLNALYRGNLEISADQMAQSREAELDEPQLEFARRRRGEHPYCHRKIRVQARITRDEARFAVADEGPGFDYSSAVGMGNLGALESLETLSGRGLVLIHSFMDEVSFNDAGNEIRMVKRRDRSVEQNVSGGG